MAASEDKKDRGKEKEKDQDKDKKEGAPEPGKGGGAKRLILIVGGTVGLLVVGLIIFLVLKSLGGHEKKKELPLSYGQVKTLKLVVVVNKTRANALKDFICEVQFIFGLPIKTNADGSKEPFEKIVKATQVDEYAKYMKENESFLREKVVRFLQDYDDKSLTESPSRVIDELKIFLIKEIELKNAGLEIANPPEMLRDINVPMFKFQP